MHEKPRVRISDNASLIQIQQQRPKCYIPNMNLLGNEINVDTDRYNQNFICFFSKLMAY
jgi:hypothetical protein